MKPDEKKLLMHILDGQMPRTCPDIPPRRRNYILDKWNKKGYYDYGVAVDLGWLTDLGRAILVPFVANDRSTTFTAYSETTGRK